MSVKIKSFIGIITMLLIFVGSGFILTYGIAEIVKWGNEHYTFVPAILFIVISGINLMLIFFSFVMYKKLKQYSLDSLFDYMINGIAICLGLTGIFFLINFGEASELFSRNITRDLLNALWVGSACYIALYKFLFNNRRLGFLLPLASLLFIATCGLAIYIEPKPFFIIGLSFIILSSLGSLVYSFDRIISSWKNQKAKNDGK